MSHKNKVMGGSKDKKDPRKENKKKAAAEQQRRAQMGSKIREKVACDARAFDVVNRLIDPGISPDFLQQACQFIDQSHYEDIVEERSISHLCGYPLCSNALQQVAKKKYHISTRSNTVYDITERKKFCSNRCYLASEHLRKQIPQTPLWTRRGADVQPFDILQQDASSHMMGEKVIGGLSFGLKEELTEIERLDQLEEKVARTPKTKSDERRQEKSHRLRNEKAPCAEETLTRGMENLSLNAGDRNRGSSMTDKLSAGTGDDCSCGRFEADITNEEDKDVRLKLTEENMSSLVGSKDLDALDREDNNAESDVSKSETTSPKSDNSKKRCDVVASKTHHLTDDSDDEDDDDQDNNEPGEKVIESHTVTKSVESVMSEACASMSHLVIDVRDARQPDDGEKKEDASQQPGESKTAYLMRLLDKRKNLLSKVADVQPHLSGKRESKPSALCNDSGDNKVESTGSPGSDRREGLEKEATGNAEEGLEKESSCEENKRKEGSATYSNTNSHLKKKKSGPAQKKTSKARKGQAEASPLCAICEIISAWVSPETLDYLGISNSTQKEKDASRRDGGDSAEKAFLKDPDMQKKYSALCQRLAGQEKDFDDMIGEEDFATEDGDKPVGRKPLPRFEELKKEAEENQLKVRQFFAGSSTINSKTNKSEEKQEDNSRPIVLPDIDSHNQVLIRRRIVLERLNNAMPSLLLPLGLSVQDVSAALRELVFTFSLTSHSIVLKPVEWTLAAVILLKMMESRCVVVKLAFDSPAKAAAINMVLGRLDHSATSLGHLVTDMLSQCAQRMGQSL